MTTAADSTTVSNIEFSETKGDPLVADESKKHKTVIKEVNYGDDIIPGTYTLGYEADDGTFKYESRDVLVNAKGKSKPTFDFCCLTSYFSDTSSSVEISDESSTAFSNSSSELRPTTRPVVTSSVYSTSRSNVIQSIPRRKTSKDDIEETSSQQPKLIFATSVPSTTSRIIMPSSPHTRPILKNGIFVRSTIPPQTHSARIEGQLIRPSQYSTTTKPQDGNYVRRVLVSRQPIVDIKSSTETQVTSSTERPTTLDNFLNEKDSVKQQRSNTFRRQLPPGDRGINNYESQQIINYHQSTGDDTTDIYGNSMITGTQRPLFTTTQNSRVLPTPTPRHLTNGRNGQYLPINPYRQKDHLVEAPTTSTSTTEEPYPTQTSVPVISIPEYSERQYQKIPPRYQEYARELGPQMEVADQHITDTPIPEDYRRQGPLQFPQATPQPLLYRQQRRNRPPQNIGYDYPDRYQQGYQQELVSNAIPEDIQPPVTNRDFQRLLHQLIFVQAKLQQLAQIAYQQNPQNFDPALYQRIQQPIQPFPPQPNPGYAVRPSPYGPVQFEQPAPPQQYIPRGHRAYLPRKLYHHLPFEDQHTVS